MSRNIDARRRVLMINLCRVCGGVEQTVERLLEYTAAQTEWSAGAVVTATVENRAFVQTCRDLADSVIELPELAAILYPGIETTPQKGASPTAVSPAPTPLQARLRRAVKRLLPEPIDLALWHRRLLQRCVPPLRRIPIQPEWDLVHAHAGTYLWFGPALQVMARERNVPVLLHLGNPPVLGDLSPGAVQLWRQARHLIFVSSSIRDAWLSAYPDLATVPHSVIHNGIDPARFPYRERLADQSKSFRIGLVSRLSQAKGIDIAIDALGMLHRYFPDIRLDIVGDGAEREVLEQQVRDLDLTSSVTFHGHQTDTHSFYQTFDLLLQPSRSEAFGITLIEAMATGLPVIAANVGGIPEVVRDNETGILIPPEDPDALADAIKRLMDNPERRQMMGKAGRKRVEENFTTDKMCGKVFALYDQILD